jgi:hypothetical protein
MSVPTSATSGSPFSFVIISPDVQESHSIRTKTPQPAIHSCHTKRKNWDKEPQATLALLLFFPTTDHDRIK